MSLSPIPVGRYSTAFPPSSTRPPRVAFRPDADRPDPGDRTVMLEGPPQRSQTCVGWVVVLNGPYKGMDFRLVPGPNRLGTSANNDIVLTDGSVSHHHAIIRYDDGQFVLTDLDSTHGTRIRSEKIARQTLSDRDRFTVGLTQLRFVSLN
jgi:hypothetical protein